MSLDRNEKRLTERHKDEPPSRQEIIKDFDRDLYETGLSVKANSTGSDSIDARLERKFGEMRTGNGYGLRPTHNGITEIEEHEGIIKEDGLRS